MAATPAIAYSIFAGWFMLLGLGGAAGIPLGVPPALEDPLLAKVAPEECAFYMTWSGIAEPDPQSSNRTEQLLAEPEVQRLIGELQRRLKASALEAAGRDDPEAVPLVEDASEWIKTLLTSPTVVFISSVKMGPEGPDIRGGALVRVGEDAAKLKASLEKHQAAVFGPAVAQPVQIAGETWYKLQLDPHAPEITWGVRGKYFIIGLGKGSVAGILSRAVTDPPEWLTELRKQLPVDRASTVSYVNVKGLGDTFAPILDAPTAVGMLLQAFGLGGVTSVGSVTGLDKEGFVSKTLVALDGEPRGLLSIAAGKPLTSGDLAPIPRDATIALGLRADADAIFESFLSSVAATNPAAREGIAEGLAAMKQATGVDLRGDVLKALGDTWCVYNSPGEGGLAFTGLTAVVPVKDHQSLAAAHAKLIVVAKAALAAQEASRRAEAERLEAEGHYAYYLRRPGPRIEQFEFAGQTVYVFNVRGRGAPFAPAWCLTEKELIGALFPQNIKAYLTRGQEHKSLATVPEVAGLLEGTGGPVALAYLDSPRLFDVVYPVIPMFAQSLLGEMQREGIDIEVSILPQAGAIRRHLRPGAATVRRTAAGIELSSRGTIPGGSMGALAPMAAFVKLPPLVEHQRLEMIDESFDTIEEVPPDPALP